MTDVKKHPMDISQIDFGNLKFETDNKDIIDRLDKIIELLEEKERKEVYLTAQEDCVLILEQMLKYGQCEQSNFRAKAKSYGYDSKLCEYAEEYLKVKVEFCNGKTWLKRKDVK